MTTAQLTEARITTLTAEGRQLHADITAKTARQTPPPTPPPHQPYPSKNPWLMAAASVPWLHYC